MMAEFSEMEHSLEMLNHFGDMENPSIALLGFNADSFYSQQQNLGLPFVDSLLGLMPDETNGFVSEEIPECKRGKTIGVLETSSGNNSGHHSESVVTEEKRTKKNGSGSGKRGRNKLKEVEKEKEVVHVRARRGQATDSHSLAERVRREKINERMRCLQDLVPGCYKTMGMAGMLDEIINYVQSLQNQVEFLSMKLSAASSFYDFSMDNDTMATPQIGNIYEAEEVEKLVREGYGGCTSFYSAMPF